MVKIRRATQIKKSALKPTETEWHHVERGAARAELEHEALQVRRTGGHDLLARPGTCIGKRHAEVSQTLGIDLGYYFDPDPWNQVKSGKCCGSLANGFWP